MLKGIFLCALLVVLSANSMAQPTGSADPDAIVEREASSVVDAFRKMLNGPTVNKKREAGRIIPIYPEFERVHAKKVYPLYG